MIRKGLRLGLLVALVIGIASAGLAYNQMTVYAYDGNGQTVDGVTITVEGVNNDYYEQKSTEYNYDSFFDYTAGEEYHITVEENNGDRFGEKTVEAGSSEGVFVTMDSEGGDENSDPSVELESPASNAEGVALSPQFSWSGSDPDGDSLEYEFYIEEKSYSSDKPWSAEPETTTDTQLTPDSDLDENTEYVWGVKAMDGNGGTDQEYRYFTTGEQDTNSDPDVDLENPSSGATDVTLSPQFSWSGTDPDGDSLDYEFYIEEKSYSSDRPWSASPEETSSESFTLGYDLDEDTEYVWGVKVFDGNGGTDQEYRYFTTGQQEEPNNDPDVDLEHPNSGETGVELDPEFRWSGSDPDDDSLDYEFYIEEKSYDDDKPWSASPEDTSSESITLSYDLDHSTEYVWGVKAMDGNGGTDQEYRYFETEDEQTNRDPDVDLHSPDSGETGVEVRPDFSWSGSDPDGDSLDYEFYMEERTYDDDRPWSASPIDTSSTSYTPSSDLQREEEYVWGVKVFDNNGGTDQEYRYFTTEDELQCGFSVSDLELDDRYITRGDSTQARFTLENTGDQQDVDVELRVGTNTKIDRSITLDEGETKEYERTISPSTDSVVKYVVETDGEPCGSETYVDSEELYVNPDDGDDGDDDLDASFSYTPTSPGVGETVSFTSTSYDSDGEITDYRWEMGDSTVKHGSSVDHEYSSSGTYTVQLRITDADGNTDYTTRQVTVSEEDASPPDASFTWSPTSPQAEEDIQFSSTSTDPDGDITSYTWEMGDGTTKTGSSVTHQYPTKGEYPVQLTVEDSEGQTDSYSRDIDVGTQYTDCSYSVSDLRLSEKYIDRGESAQVSFTLSNDGDRQRFLIDMKSDGKVVNERELIVDGGDQASFSYQVSPKYDAVVKAVIQTEGEPCMYDQTVRFDEIYVNQPEDGDDGDDGDDDDEVEDAELTVEVRDEDGDRLNANVRVDNGESRSGYTGSDGDRTFSLEPGSYDLRVSKDGYITENRDIYLSESEEMTRRVTLFREEDDVDQDGDIQIDSIDAPSSVCRGDSFRAYADITNYGGYDVFTMEGTGPASGGTETFALSEDRSVTRSIRFTNVQGSGTEEFQVHVENGDTDTRGFDVEVNDCTSGYDDGVSATSISMDIADDRTFPNQPVKVRGYVDGVNTRTEVEIESNGERIAAVSTQPDGYYQTYIRREEIGSHSISASAAGKTVYRDLEVVPTASVNFVDAPEEVFQGETFEMCADVNSQIEPDVVLLRDGDVVETRSGSGEVCFDLDHQKPGDYDYQIRALTYGQGSSDSTELKVLEADSEAESFPDQVASVESGSGIVKVDLYNTHQDTRRYDLSLNDIEDTWVAQSEKEVILGRGERETVYFYLTPQDEGVFNPEVVVESDGSEIYRNSITVTTGGTHDERNNPDVFDRVRGFMSSWL